jgi:hypothetical protein
MVMPATPAEERFEQLLQAPDFAPPTEFAAQAKVADAAVYEQAAADPQAWWAGQARQRLDWDTPFATVLDDSNPPFYRWFADGTLNASYNCLDRHVQAGHAQGVGDGALVPKIGQRDDHAVDGFAVPFEEIGAVRRFHAAFNRPPLGFVRSNCDHGVTRLFDGRDPGRDHFLADAVACDDPDPKRRHEMLLLTMVKARRAGHAAYSRRTIMGCTPRPEGTAELAEIAENILLCGLCGLGGFF